MTSLFFAQVSRYCNLETRSAVQIHFPPETRPYRSGHIHEIDWTAMEKSLLELRDLFGNRSFAWDRKKEWQALLEPLWTTALSVEARQAIHYRIETSFDQIMAAIRTERSRVGFKGYQAAGFWSTQFALLVSSSIPSCRASSI